LCQRRATAAEREDTTKVERDGDRKSARDIATASELPKKATTKAIPPRRPTIEDIALQ